MSIEYIKPEDRYDIGVFNRNFKAVEDAVNQVRPIDWIDLPDISQETKQTVVMLLHLQAGAVNRFGIQMQQEKAGEPLMFTIDWGDGSVTTTPDYINPSNLYYYYIHDYDFTTVDEPTTGLGDKQIIVKVTENIAGTNNKIIWFFPYFTNIVWDGVSHYTNYNLLREMAIQAGDNTGLQINLGNNLNLRSMKGYNLTYFSSSYAVSLAEIELTGNNLKYFVATYNNVQKLHLPGSAYTALNCSNSRMREVVINDLGNIAATPNFANSRCLERIILGGLNRAATITNAPLTREAIVEFFQNLGTASGAQTLNLTTCLGYPDLTDADKQIARDKGWTVT